MTVDEIITRVNAIGDMKADPEVAHVAEDTLHQDVLRAIVQGGNGDSPERLAAAALQTLNLDLERWYA